MRSKEVVAIFNALAQELAPSGCVNSIDGAESTLSIGRVKTITLNNLSSVDGEAVSISATVRVVKTFTY